MAISIATKLGDKGETSLAGGKRVSKADLRVEAYGTVDELNSTLGWARSICPSAEVRDWTEAIQKKLFGVGGALATPEESQKRTAPLASEDVEWLTERVHEIEGREGILSDWSIPGSLPASAAYEVARTVCRRAERCIVRLMESGEGVHPDVLPYVNRLSDLIWLFGRLLEVEAGVNSQLRDDQRGGARWSRAW